MACRVFSVAAHPDDIEFGMAGTLILLAKAGCEIHYMTIASGSFGSSELLAETIASIRLKEAKNAAARIGAVFHPSLVGDLEIYYEKNLVARMGSVMREVAPEILLVHSPEDYMEDHMAACRLAVTAAFSRGMKNFNVDPPREPVFNEVTVYHAQPHGNRDILNRLVIPDFFVDISSVMDEKSAMLAEHKSQSQWLELTQGFNAYINTMKDFGNEMGKFSGRCEFAEGWRYHNPLGLCSLNKNPLVDLLRDRIILPT